MKEFLIKHGVVFVSINVLEDKDAFAELAALGIRSVPIVRRGQGRTDHRPKKPLRVSRCPTRSGMTSGS